MRELTTLQHVKEQALAAGFTEWHNGTHWRPIVAQTDGVARWVAPWFDAASERYGADSMDGGRYAWRLRRPQTQDSAA